MTDTAEKGTGTAVPVPLSGKVVPGSTASERRKVFPFLRLASEQAPPPEIERARRLALLRTRVAKEMHDRGWSRLAVLPLTVGAGATTVALELTWALLRQQGVRVTLVDLNFLEPSIARQLELDGCSPVTDQIKSGAELDALLVELPEQPGLRVLAPAAPEPYPAELLQSPSFARALAAMLERQDSDYVIMDLSALLGSDVGMSALPLAESILMVADGMSTKPADMKLAERYLADEAPLMGVVLNKAEK